MLPKLDVRPPLGWARYQGGDLTQERSWLVLVCVNVSLPGQQVLLAYQLHGERMSTVPLHLPLVQHVLDISAFIVEADTMLMRPPFH